MKTAVLQAPANMCREGVKKLLTRGIIFLTSEIFFTFALMAGALFSYFGLIIDSNNWIAAGAIIFLVGFTPWSIRQTARDLRQQRLGVKNWMDAPNPLYIKPENKANKRK